MADRYVVAAGGNWSLTSTWSTSDGGSGGASVPTAGDNVYLTANSGNLNVNSGAAACLNFDCAGYVGTLSGSGNLTVSGTTFRLSSGMTCTRTSTTTFNSTSGTCQITSAGQSLTTGNVTINGGGGTFALQDAFECGGYLSILAGAFLANEHALTIGSLQGGSTSVRTIDISGCTVVLKATDPLNVSSSTNLTWDATDSVIHFTNAAATSLQFGNLTWGEVHFSPRTGQPQCSFGAAGATFESIHFAAPGAYVIGGNFSVLTPFDVTGDGSNLILLIRSSAASPTITVPSGNSTFEWCAFEGLNFSGVGSVTASNSYNLGAGAGITISPPSGGGASPEDIAAAVWDAAPAVIDANITQVNSVVIAGDGDSTPWGPA